MTYGIRNKATGAWVENCEFATREEAEAHLRAQFHREWIEDHHIEERSGTMGAQKCDIPKPYRNVTVRFTTGGRQCQVQYPTGAYGCRDSTECKTWADRLNDAYASGWVAATLPSRVAAMEEALRKIAATADMKKYRPNELEKCCMPEYALDKEGFADMPIDMLRDLRYNATIAKQALKGAGG